MTINSYKFLLFCSAIVGLNACASDPDEPKLIWDIEGDVALGLEEHIEDGSAELNFDLRTIDPAFCADATLLYRLDVTNQQLDLKVVGVDQGEGCPSPDAIASKYVELPTLDRANYSVSVTVPSRADINGLLRITESAYVLDINSVPGLIIPQQTLFKTPVDLIFGWHSDEIAKNALLDLLEPFSSGAELPVGIYQHFIFKSSGGIDARDSEYNRDKDFIAHFSGTTEDLENIMTEWRSTWGDDIDLFLFDASGKMY